MEQSERSPDPPISPLHGSTMQPPARAEEAAQQNLPYNDLSSYDGESYSGSDLDDDSFASDSDDGIVAQDGSKKEKNKIAAKENQRVFRARIFVLILLTLTAVCNAVIVHFLTLNKEQNDYDSHYNAIADEMMLVIGENVRTAYLGMDAMSDGLTTRVMDGSAASRWPLVTFPTFPSLAGDARNVTGALQIVFSPVVDETERTEWETYSEENNGWLREENVVEYEERRYRALLESSNKTSPLLDTYTVPHHPSALMGYQPNLGEVDKADSFHYPTELQQPQQRLHVSTDMRELHEDHGFRGVIPERIHPAPTREERLTPGMRYAPVWQMSPLPYYRGIINHDLLREPAFQFLSESVMETRQAVLSNELHNDLVALLFEEHNPLLVNPSNGALGNTNDHDHHGEYPPTSVMVQPVWKSLDVDPNLAGYQIALIPWEAYLVNTFRPNSDESVLAQYEYSEIDSCRVDETLSSYSSGDLTAEQMENYKVRGGDRVEYLGPGEDGFKDQDKFDYSMRRTMNFPVRAPPKPTSWMVANTATPGNDQTATENCGVLRIHLYPSDELRNVYLTSWPSTYAGLVIVVFVILASAFIIYDCSVERRRGKVMAVAEKTSRIVTSLFPSHFADQLISDTKKKEREAKKKKKKKVVIEEAPKRQLRKFMKDKDRKYKKLGDGNMNGNNAEAPLGYGDAAPDNDDSPLFFAQSKPIADLFPETTVLFADIAGFTSWSSVREPSQVFTLLETVYASFDFLAKQYGIFKIETIGDCYVAVCGLPEPRADHAVAMSRFALACMQKMNGLVSQLEVTLGPDTGDLSMRFGLHSGPVTAGILRGERARFQLFGDTVNTAARMESTGMRDKIQISQETADLLIAGGKNHWFTKRDGKVKAKGKGELQTYWVQASVTTRRQSIGSTGGTQRRNSVGTGRRGSIGGRKSSLAGSRAPSQRSNYADSGSSQSSHLLKAQSSDSDRDIPALLMGAVLSKKQQRLVDWNCELLQQLLRQVVAKRNFLKNSSRRINVPFTAMMSELPKLGGRMKAGSGNAMPLNEVVEVINLPEFDVAAYHGSTDAKHITLDASIVTQLRRYVTIMASKYRDNPFHNFDHASHVAMSVSKLLTRIVVPDLASINDRHENNKEDINSSHHVTSDMQDLHDHTYGITSDPLTQFAVVLSALIHDVDHRGVPNNILIGEEPEMAAKYSNKSVAEQNSVDIAWEVLMDDSFKALRDTICGEVAELRRLRALVVNSVLATDIFDKDMSALRKARWNKAFQVEQPEVTPFGRQLGRKQPSTGQLGRKQPSTFQFGAHARAEINRKATIVIEHLIQASDVSHTMQHWHIYQKWNECLFKEMYTAFKEGRSVKDPSDGWYKGEIWFFDNYVIPLAKKLKECGVFAVSSDEYLDYATANRTEWEEKGEAIVAEMLSKYKDTVDRSALGYE